MVASTLALRIVLGAVVLAAVTVPLTRESVAATPRERARQLFEEGRREVDLGLFGSGCAKLRDSHRLAPEAVGPLLNVADCDERAGRLASARRRFVEVQSLPGASDERRAYARERAQRLEPRVPRVFLVPPPDAPDAMVVLRDGAPMGDDFLSAPLRLDPGTYRFTVTAPGYADRFFDVVLEPRSVHHLALGLGTRVAPSTPEPIRTRAPSGSPPPRQLAGWILVGAGSASLLVGAVTGVLVGVHAQTVRRECDAEQRCTERGLDAAAAGRPLAIVSPVALGVGAVALGVGIPLIVIDPSAPGPPISEAAAGLSLGRERVLLGIKGRF